MLGLLLVAVGLLVPVYAYLLYPAALVLLARWRPRPLRPDPGWQPSVAVLLAVRDEAPRLAARLEQLLAQDYPRARLQIRVLDDGSGDETPRILKDYAAQGVQSETVTPAQGKAAALNRLVAGAVGEVLVLVDCRQRLPPDVVRLLVAALGDPTFGAVSGELVLEEPDGRPSPSGLGHYWRFERRLRQAEATFASAVQVSGALYAIRRELFPPLPPGLLLDDLAVPLGAARHGPRIGFVPEARAYDTVADPGTERRRKLRTLGGNLELVVRWPWLLLPWRNRLWLPLLSHKLARLVVPYALICFLIGAFLIPSPYLWILLGLIGLCLVIAGLGRRRVLPGPLGTLARLGWTVLDLNLAALLGPWLWLTGRLTWRGKDGRGAQEARGSDGRSG